MGSNIRRAFPPALDITKIQDLHLHDLRHTFSTSMVQAGIDLYKFQIEPEILIICRVAWQFLQYQPRINLSDQSKKSDPLRRLNTD